MRIHHCLFMAGSVALGFAVTHCSGATARPTHDGKVLFFGNLHAHSRLSDDVSNASVHLLPIDAFRYANQNGLDFLAITDHHKATNSFHRLWMTNEEYRTLLFELATQFNATNEAGFIAIPGIEWGTTATGNHINLIGAKWLPPDAIQDRDYDKIIEWAKTNCDFVQFNHPKSWRDAANRDLTVGNFGENLYPDQSAFVTRVNPTVRTVAILNSVRGGHIGGALRNSTAKTHRDVYLQDKYYELLNMGFHISPSADQDTHGTNWGTVTAARTAVWADEANYSGLMTAFRSNRVYATEDDEMVVVFQVRYLNKVYWMGETVNLQTNEADIELLVKVSQRNCCDGDSTDEGPYRVEVFVDEDGVGGSKPAGRSAVQVQADTLTVLPETVRAGQYLFLVVTEENGKDNPIGEGGDDEMNNSTGIDGADGRRDNMNDSAWTTPVWFVGQIQGFVWSVNSDKYHDATCWAVKTIGDANKRSGTEPPPNKTKHNCHS